jgi:hypothetical protein
MINASRIRCAVLALFAVMPLASCYHAKTNPLLSMSRQQAAFLLAHASLRTERTMHLVADGYSYGDCIQGKQRQIDCHQLYMGMLTDLKRDKRCSYLRIEQLKDPTVFKRIRTAYQKAAYEIV